MTSPWIAAIFALFVWWFSTGVILLVVRRADRSEAGARWLPAVYSLPLVALGVAGVASSLGDGTSRGVYTAFLSALALWGWIELAFLSGIITGPVRHACPPGLSGWDRFARAFGTLAYHEGLLTAVLLVLAVVSSGAENQFALWTYTVLYGARISAKLNLFFGVPRINVEFVPAPLEHLKSYFNQGPVTPFFPVTITMLSFAVACFAERLWSAPEMGAQVGFSLLTALSTLALLEHWLMVLPLPDAKLWRWMLPAPKAPAKGVQHQD